MITGLDLVDLQIQVAQGYSLPELGIPSTDVIKPKGNTIMPL
jgi:pyruvate carboxylase